MVGWNPGLENDMATTTVHFIAPGTPDLNPSNKLDARAVCGRVVARCNNEFGMAMFNHTIAHMTSDQKPCAKCAAKVGGMEVVQPLWEAAKEQARKARVARREQEEKRIDARITFATLVEAETDRLAALPEFKSFVSPAMQRGPVQFTAEVDEHLTTSVVMSIGDLHVRLAGIPQMESAVRAIAVAITRAGERVASFHDHFIPAQVA